jgi:hypothetical protein
MKGRNLRAIGGRTGSRPPRASIAVPLREVPRAIHGEAGEHSGDRDLAPVVYGGVRGKTPPVNPLPLDSSMLCDYRKVGSSSDLSFYVR